MVTHVSTMNLENSSHGSCAAPVANCHGGQITAQSHVMPRSPLPTAEALNAAEVQHSATESWDAAQEMDPLAEEGEFARFISRVKGKNIAEVRREIDDEITALHRQRKSYDARF